MAIGNIHQVPVSKWKPNGKHLKCKDCLYGNPNSCPRGVAKLCGVYQGWISRYEQNSKFYYEIFETSYTKTKIYFDKKNILEIIDDPLYYEYDTEIQERIYFYCQTCGYIKPRELTHEHDFLDLHCNCGDNITCTDLTLEEIKQIKNDEKMSDLMNYDLED